jgi:hypothetical protein
MVKAKFRVNGIFGGTIDGAESKRIEMSPVFASEVGKEGNACEENAIFGKYTPAGHISITIVNPAAFEQFEVNKEYYVDFFSVEDCQDKAEDVEEKEDEKVEEETQEEEKTEGQEESNPETSSPEGEEKTPEEGTSQENATTEPAGETTGEIQTNTENTEGHTIAEGEPAGEGTPAQTV